MGSHKTSSRFLRAQPTTNPSPVSGEFLNNTMAGIQIHPKPGACEPTGSVPQVIGRAVPSCSWEGTDLSPDLVARRIKGFSCNLGGFRFYCNVSFSRKMKTGMKRKRVCRRGELILLITKKYLLIPSNLPTEPKTETGGGGITRCNFRPTSGLI